MLIKDTFIINAPVETVWDFFLDIERVSQCVPGVESCEIIDDKNYRGTLKVKVGPISASFNGVAVLEEVEPPRRLVASVGGDDQSTKSLVKATFSSTFEPVETGTQIAYEMDVNMRGRLAQFGSTVIKGVAKKMTTQLVSCVQTALNPAETGESDEFQISPT